MLGNNLSSKFLVRFSPDMLYYQIIKSTVLWVIEGVCTYIGMVREMKFNGLIVGFKSMS